MRAAPQFTIEDGIPLPRKSVCYPVEQLDAGQSFLVSYYGKTPTKAQIHTIRASLYEAIDRAKDYWRKQGVFVSYTTRALDEGIRVWRKI